MTRRQHLTLLTAVFATSSSAIGKDNDSMREVLETSQNEKKGIMLYCKGQTIGGVVTKVGADFVELRSREYSRIVFKIDSIDGAAMS
jgi:hypothetical protein